MAKMKITIVGNCQSQPLAALLAALCPDMEFVAPPPVHRIDAQGVANFLACLDQYDVVVTQPVKAGYRGNLGINTENVHSMLRPTQRLVLIPNMYFDGFFPTWGYMKYKDGGLRGKVELHKTPDDAYRGIIGTFQRSDYQCFLLLCAWLEGLTVSQAVALLETPFDSELVRSWYADSLTEFAGREQACRTRMAPVLQSIAEHPEYRFYSFNHPNKSLLTTLALQVLDILRDAPQADDASILTSRVAHLADRFDHVSLPIYPFVSSSLGLQRREGTVLRIYDSEFSIPELVANYYVYFNCLGEDGLAVNASHQKYKLSQKLIAVSSQAG
jgi:hypothetical protein